MDVKRERITARVKAEALKDALAGLNSALEDNRRLQSRLMAVEAKAKADVAAAHEACSKAMAALKRHTLGTLEEFMHYLGTFT